MKTPITILYTGSDSSAVEPARNLATRLSAEGHEVVGLDIAHYVASNLLAEDVVLFCIGSSPEGEADELHEFLDFLDSLEPGELCRLRYSVLCLPSDDTILGPQWGRRVDQVLEGLGAARMVSRVQCSFLAGTEYFSWARSVSKALTFFRRTARMKVPVEL